MFKKLWVLLAVLFSHFCAIANAGNLYFAPSLFLQDNLSHTSNYRGLYPRLAVGYSEMFPDFYFGAEVFGDPLSATLADNHNNATSARSTWSIGASILPGTMFTESILGFLRASIISTKFSSAGATRAGGQIGLGLQTCLTPYWDFRTEYIYTAYKSIPGLGSIKTDQVGIGLVYKVLG